MISLWENVNMGGGIYISGDSHIDHQSGGCEDEG